MPVTHVPLSLTETYCESWGTWEGVRELIQNVHDGALEAGGAKWASDGGDAFACRDSTTNELVASVTYDAVRKRLVLTNRSVSLQRRVLLLGASRKADSIHAIGQFGEGMKVGALALLREGRSVEMLTSDERWRWTRRMDDAFGVRVLTVEVSERATAATLLLDGDHALTADGVSPPAAAAAAAHGAHDDTVVLVEPISPEEWATYASRFLFLTPAADSFRSQELGELLLDEALRGMLYVKGIWIADMRQEYALGSGLNLMHLRLDRDRRAVVHASDLESQAAALWVRAINARPALAQHVLTLMQQPTPGADVRRVAEFMSGQTAVADALALEWFGMHGDDAVPMSQTEASRLSGSLYELEKRLGKRLIVVNQQVLDVLSHASAVPSVKALEDELLARTTAAKLHPTNVPWAALPEEARQVARTVQAVLHGAGHDRWDVCRLVILDYGEGEFGDDADETPPTRSQPAAMAPSASRAAAAAPSKHAVGAAAAGGAAASDQNVVTPPTVPLACFSLEAVHARLGGCLQPVVGHDHGGGGSSGCACRETVLLLRVCGHATAAARTPSPPRTTSKASAGVGAPDLALLLGPCAPAGASSAVSSSSSSQAARASGSAPRSQPCMTLLDRAVASLMREAVRDAPPPPALSPFKPSVAAECARREQLLRETLAEVEEGAASERSSSLAELRSVHAEVRRLSSAMLEQEVAACNEANRARAQAQAGREVSTERKRLEAKVAELERRNADVVRQLHEAQTELSHARSKATSVAEKAAAEREAHNTWQAHVDATLDHCRQRLVARTEQIYQVTKLQQQPVAVENGGTAEDGGMIMTAEGRQGEVASIAAALRREREGGLCSVCVGAPKSAVLLPCRHELCESCAAVVSAHSGRCPLCREPVASVSDLRYLTCQVCFDDHPAMKGIECSGAGEARAGGGEAEGEGGGGSEGAKHFLCDDCLSSHVCAAIDSGSIDAFAQRGGVCCVHLGCTAPPFAETALARALPEEVFARYMAAKQHVAEQRINAELERGFEARLATLYERNGGVAPREAIKQHVCERILTLSCPRCKQAFVDFDGCWALYCARAGCGCGYCGICLEDCQGGETPKAGHDAVHRHVNACPMLARMGMARRVHSEEDWEDVSRQAKILRLREYLDTLPEAPRQHAIEDCERELRDLGIDPAALGKAELAVVAALR